MKVLLKPEEIVKLGYWDRYSYFIVGSDKEAEKILKENKEFELSERDAYVIGILKGMQTNNLTYKFILYMTDNILPNKSRFIRSENNDGNHYINKNTLNDSIDKYMMRYPDYWAPDLKFKEAFDDLKLYISDFRNSLSNIEEHELTYLQHTSKYYLLTAVKKLLKFNYM